jgi:hypothetical protein
MRRGLSKDSSLLEVEILTHEELVENPWASRRELKEAQFHGSGVFDPKALNSTKKARLER